MGEKGKTSPIPEEPRGTTVRRGLLFCLMERLVLLVVLGEY